MLKPAGELVVIVYLRAWYPKNLLCKTNENNAGKSVGQNRLYLGRDSAYIPTVNIAQCALNPGDENLI